MSLAYLVAASKANQPLLKKYDPKKAVKNLIDETNFKEKTKVKDESWTTCKHLKIINGKEACVFYCSFCAKEKCKHKYRDFGKSVDVK